MKKQVLFASLISMCLLNGCQGSSGSVQNSTAAAESVVESSVAESAPAAESSAPSVSDIPNKEALSRALSIPVTSIGCSVGKMSFDNIRDGATFDVDVIMESDGEPLIFSCFYIDATNAWNVLQVTGRDSGHCYWIGKGYEDSADLYDYSSGSLLSSKDPNFDLHDVASSLADQSDKIADDFEADLESIADKYK